MEDKSTFNESIQTVKEKKNRINGSDFIVTINTNKTTTCCSEEKRKRFPLIEQKFKETIKYIFDENNLRKILEKVEGKGKNKQTFPVTDKDIVSVKAKTNIEISKYGTGALHSHTYIRVMRKSKIRVNIGLIKNVFYKVMEKYLTFDGKFEKPYINVRGVNSTSINFEQYVSGN